MINGRYVRTALLSGWVFGFLALSAELHGDCLPITVTPSTLASATNGVPVNIAFSASSPETRTTTSLSAGHYDHQDTLLADGRVLVVGGYDDFGGVTADAEIYDRHTALWSSVPLSEGRFENVQARLQDGKVLVAGGYDFDLDPVLSAYLFEPTNNTWSATTPLPSGFAGPALVLTNGKVLCIANDTLLYDPVAQTWTPSGSLNLPRSAFSVTLLADGKVLVAGGIWDIDPVYESEIYDPAAGTWTVTGTNHTPFYVHTATLLPNGKVLAVGGVSDTPQAEIYDPATGQWSVVAAPAVPRLGHKAVLLPSGLVMIEGGWTNQQTGEFTQTAELYDFVTDTWATPIPLQAPRMSATATLLDDGTVLLAGGRAVNDFVGTTSAEIFDPSVPITGAKFGVTGGALPGGLSLATKGVLTGTPNAAGTSTFTITATNTSGCTGARNYSVTIPCNGLTVTSDFPPYHFDSFGKYMSNEVVVKATGGTPPYTYVLTSSSLPSWITFSNGTLTGYAFPVGSYDMEVTATDANGCSGDGSVSLLVGYGAGETNPPTVTITRPANGAVVETPSVTVIGKAADRPAGINQNGLAIVTYSLNGSAFAPVATTNGFTNWSVNISPQAGKNTLIVTAYDQSKKAFSVTNIYYAARTLFGTYDGLFYPTDGGGNPAISMTNSGRIQIVLHPGFHITGKLFMGGGAYPLGGAIPFVGSGNHYGSIANRGPLPYVAVDEFFDLSGVSRQVTGVVHCDGEGWAVPFVADLAVYSAAAHQYPTPGRYTMAIPQAGDAPDNSPGGYGYATINVSSAGTVMLSGALADSSPFSESVPISVTGKIPLFASLYKKQGLLAGWLDFSSGAPSGQLTWIKPANPTGVTLTTYPGGFTNVIDAFGSAYVPATPAILVPNGTLSISNGSGLNLPLTLNAAVSNNNKIVSMPATTNLLTGAINAPTGLVKLSFRPTDVGKITKPAIGVVLQNSNAVFGAFIGNNDGTGKTNTGAIYLH